MQQFSSMVNHKEHMISDAIGFMEGSLSNNRVQVKVLLGMLSTVDITVIL